MRGRCLIKSNERCFCGHDARDSPSYQCVGGPNTFSVTKCTFQRPSFFFCERDTFRNLNEPFNSCGFGQICSLNRCRSPEYGWCTIHAQCLTSRCDKSRLECKNPVPRRYRELRAQCSSDSQCEPDLECKSGYCMIRKGEKCAKRTAGCVRGLDCHFQNVNFKFGFPIQVQRCVRWLYPGFKCTPPPKYRVIFDLCGYGSECVTVSSTESICKFPLGASCSLRRSNCMAGLKCVGYDNIMHCIIPRELGERCMDDSYCRRGLVCNRFRMCATFRVNGALRRTRTTPKKSLPVPEPQVFNSGASGGLIQP